MGSGLATIWRRWVCGLSRSTSAAGMTDARSCVPRSQTRLSTPSGFAWYQMHRADLLTTLLRALPPERVHVGYRLVGLVDHGDAVEADFENGKSVLVDALVGADGIHSTVQRILFGPRSAHFTGCAAYRGLIPAERLSHLDLEVTCDVWMGPGRHFVHYFVRNKQLFNFVTAVEQDSWTGESWTDKVDVATALAEFDGWHPQVRAIITAVDETCTSGRCSTARRSNAGRSGARRSSAMPAIRCCRSWPKALRKRSRTAQRSRLASRAPAAQTSRWHSIATSSCGYPAPHVFKRGPLPTRRASTSRTVPNKRNATHRWRPDRPTSRDPRSPGSTNTTPPSSNRRNGERTRRGSPTSPLVVVAFASCRKNQAVSGSESDERQPAPARGTADAAGSRLVRERSGHPALPGSPGSPSRCCSRSRSSAHDL